ncbi:MAG: MFS transporter [Patescibacteria group bacterium]
MADGTILGIRRQWLVLGIAVLGLNASVTVLAFYLPVVLSRLTESQAAVGFGVGIEGLVALTIPLIIGRASDRRGKRLPYMLAATPLIIAGLLGVAILDSYWPLVAAVTLYFIGYYAYYTAYQSLYPDLLPAKEYGRAWSVLNVFQGIGVGLALVGGGALLAISDSAPFLGAAGVLLVTTALAALLIRERRPGHLGMKRLGTLRTLAHHLRTDVHLRLFLPAHFGWEFSLAAIRAFVLLYLLRGLGIGEAALVGILGVVLLAYLVAAVTSGNIIDRFDPRRYTTGVILLFTAAMFTLGLTTDETVLRAILPFGVFSGAAVLMLAYPILLQVTPPNRHGEYTGYYQANRGLALIAGTVGTGWLIDRFGGAFPATDGYQVLWLTAGTVVLLTVPFFWRLTRRSA